MGAEGWSYFVPYREDVAEALRDLKQREFAAGGYSGSEDGPASIEAVYATMEASGTGSVLDMIDVAGVPRNPNHDVHEEYQIDHESDEDYMFSLAAPLAARQLVALFGTQRPTREMIEANFEHCNLLDRGMGLYIVVYEGDTPTELFFAGLSWD